MAERRGTVFLMLGMLAWIVAAVVGTLAMWGILALVSRILAPDVVAEPGRLVYLLLGAFGFHGTLILGALRQGRRSTGGDWREGVGARRILHQGWIAVFCMLTIGWLIVATALTAAIPALRDYLKSMSPEFLLSDLGDANSAILALLILLTVVLAPVAEEFFFRGWLWEALRRRGRTVTTTACLTAVPWLLLHGIESPGRILLLVPAAVIFSFARQMGGGVLASLTVHVTNNLSVVLVQAAAMIFGHR